MNELPRLRSGLATGIIQDDIDNNSLELMNVALLVLMSGANLAVGVQGGLATLSSIVGSHTLILASRGASARGATLTLTLGGTRNSRTPALP